MTLREALWVTERDYSRYFAPGTSVSITVADTLTHQDASLGERRFDSFVLYRRGLTYSSPATEQLIVIGFDPASIPRNRR